MPPPLEHDPWRRVWVSSFAVLLIVIAGTAAYMVLGLSFIDALYQTVTTISTVGFREIGEPTTAWKLTTIVVIIVGAGSALYTLGVVLENLVEGRLSDRLGRRRMERRVAGMKDHVIICGWGRVGRAIQESLSAAGDMAVVIDVDPARAASAGDSVVLGDATDDDVLREAGIERARCLVVALVNDSDNVYVTLSARALRPDLLIVARARTESAYAKLLQAGANRVVNPQQIGGARMAALAIQPAVADFLDVVMHDGGMEFRLAEARISEHSMLVGRTVQDAQIRDATGALVLAVREPDGTFLTNPSPTQTLCAEQVLIVIGTEGEISSLQSIAAGLSA
ncbi:MAG: potassium channel protein [Acidimicrobiales bacterium]|nr:potassium channel protein [Acidimicrobiales bacterium]